MATHFQEGPHKDFTRCPRAVPLPETLRVVLCLGYYHHYCGVDGGQYHWLPSALMSRNALDEACDVVFSSLDGLLKFFFQANEIWLATVCHRGTCSKCLCSGLIWKVKKLLVGKPSWATYQFYQIGNNTFFVCLPIHQLWCWCVCRWCVCGCVCKSGGARLS